MTGKRTTGKRRSTSTPRGRRRNVAQSHRAPFFLKWLNRYPRWTWWVGGIGIALLYIWVFYYFFVSPTGFRWRALYGDAKYPDGYEIHGIDISHYQGKIDWDMLQGNAMIEG